MATEPVVKEIVASETLAPISDLQDYGATIIAELDRAEAELGAADNQPFSGMSAEVMRDMAALRDRQFDMFRRHVEIEQGYKIENAVVDGNDVQRMSFSGIAKTMRKKESATAGLLDKLAQFDQQLRLVVDKFETPVAEATVENLSNHPREEEVVAEGSGVLPAAEPSSRSINHGLSSRR